MSLEVTHSFFLVESNDALMQVVVCRVMMICELYGMGVFSVFVHQNTQAYLLIKICQSCEPHGPQYDMRIIFVKLFRNTDAFPMYYPIPSCDRGR